MGLADGDVNAAVTGSFQDGQADRVLGDKRQRVHRMGFFSQEVEIFDHPVEIGALDQETGIFAFFPGEVGCPALPVQGSRHNLNISGMAVGADGLQGVGMDPFGDKDLVATFVATGQKQAFGRPGRGIVKRSVGDGEPCQARDIALPFEYGLEYLVRSLPGRAYRR